VHDESVLAEVLQAAGLPGWATGWWLVDASSSRSLDWPDALLRGPRQARRDLCHRVQYGQSVRRLKERPACEHKTKGTVKDMAKARDTFTDRLSNVIEVVELGRRTGLLAVERGTPAHSEEGEIFFVNGRAIYAAVAQMRGREALAALGQWGACRFAFDTDAAAPSPNIVPVASPAGISGEYNAATPARVPSAGWGATASTGGTTGDSGWGAPNGAPPRPLPQSGRLGSSGAWSSSQPGSSSGTWSTSQPGVYPSTGPLGRRPRRAPDVRDLMSVVSSHNLSRSHRTILLLADGSHNVLDVARLASKSVDEITQLLAELEARGLIYYYE
jgi:hypothetical protein